MHKISYQLLFLAAGASTLIGCPRGAALDDPEQYVDGTNCDATPIFESSCQGSGCHGSVGDTEDSPAPAGGVNLFQPQLAARTVDIDAVYPGLEGDPACPTDMPEKLIDSGDVELSLMISKLNGQHACGSGMPIPISVSQLSDDEIDCIRSYSLRLIEEVNGEDTAPTADELGSSPEKVEP
ncbi:MAG: hypothetical protein MK135_17490 [Polyangiaceae bacterium]|nr:hypothetical protein [Polyangiaceae bacterium]